MVAAVEFWSWLAGYTTSYSAPSGTAAFVAAIISIAEYSGPCGTPVPRVERITAYVMSSGCLCET
jgi:hypothetical protein